MSCPWAKVQATQQIVSFDEITSEELARSLQEKKCQKHEDTMTVKDALKKVEKIIIPSYITDTDSVKPMTYTLQSQFNQEHDLMLKRTEEKFNNGTSKGKKTRRGGRKKREENKIKILYNMFLQERKSKRRGKRRKNVPNS